MKAIRGAARTLAAAFRARRAVSRDRDRSLDLGYRPSADTWRSGKRKGKR